MAYKRITQMDISEVIRRWKDGQTITHISKVLGYDRKTVRKHLSDFDKEDTRKFPGRPARKQKLLEPYLNEITDLVTNKANPLKPKTAFEVICLRHDLSGKVSYSSFKRFVRSHGISIFPDRSTCRIEVRPAAQLQVDYGRMGLLRDPLTGKRRTVYAFVGTLSFSRHKYVEFVYRQDQQSFVNSHVKMFNEFGGVPKTIVIDNLKAGIIKPDLYDPRLNRTYNEMAEYYECFIDPCRVARPKDKGKAERDIQTVREQFKKLIALNPSFLLAEGNDAIRDWLRNDYGRRKHGTTHQEPYVVFTETEKPLLLPLPLESYEVVLWKEALVHPDHYIQVNKKAYSVPHPYVGKTVWVKVKHNLIQIYYNDELIRQHTIPQGFRQTNFNDFPDNVRYALYEGMPDYLCKKAARIGVNFALLIQSILKPHAFLNLRKAQGIVSVAQKYPAEIIEDVSRFSLSMKSSLTPKIFKSMIENVQQRNIELNSQLSLSDETAHFVRGMDYFTYIT